MQNIRDRRMRGVNKKYQKSESSTQSPYDKLMELPPFSIFKRLLPVFAVRTRASLILFCIFLFRRPVPAMRCTRLGWDRVRCLFARLDVTLTSSQRGGSDRHASFCRDTQPI